MINRRHAASLMALAITTVTAQFSTGQILQTSIKLPNIIEEFDFCKQSGKHILLPVRMGDRNYHFMVDTGASNIIYDTSLRDHLGQIRKIGSIKTANGDGRIEIYDAPEAFLGSFNLRTEEKVFCMDLSLSSKSIGADIKGVVGMSFLKNYIIHIDFNRRKLAILNKLGSNVGVAVDISRDKSLPFIEIRLPDLGVREFLVDTGGNFSMILNRNEFDTLIQKNNMKIAKEIKFTDGFSSQNRRTGVTDQAIVGKLVMREVSVYESQGPEACVGLQLLRRYQCTFDFPEKKLYFGGN